MTPAAWLLLALPSLLTLTALIVELRREKRHRHQPFTRLTPYTVTHL